MYQARVQVVGSNANCYYNSDWSDWVAGPAVANVAPTVANAVADQTVAAGSTVDVALGSVFSDRNGDTLTLTATSGATGTATVALSGATLTITGVAAGTATITVTASDGTDTVSDTFDVTVTSDNAAPTVASAIADQTVAAGSTVDVALGSVFSDADGDTLSYTATSGATGTATVAVSGATLTITGVAAGTATITVTASDGTAFGFRHLRRHRHRGAAPAAAEQCADGGQRHRGPVGGGRLHHRTWRWAPCSATPTATR